MEIDWYSIYIQQSNSVMTFWNVYIVVSVGMVGFVIQKGEAITSKDRNVFVFGFVLFAVSNLYPMFEAQSDLLKVYKKLPDEALFSEPPIWPLVVVLSLIHI